MPMSGSNYVAPTWVDKAPPALDAAELQAMCNTIQENQGDVASLQSVVSSLNSLVNGKAQAQVVSYVGTGTYGASTPCSITASFPIDVAMYLGSSRNNGQTWNNPHNAKNENVFTNTLSTSYLSHQGFWVDNASSSSYAKISSDKRTITWYNSSYIDQLNENAFTYYFLCIAT